MIDHKKFWKDKLGGELQNLTFLVDKQVNINKDMSLDEALEFFVPDVDLRRRVREEYNRWHRKD